MDKESIIIKDLELKQTKLLNLKKGYDKANEAKIEFFKGDVTFAAARLRDTQRMSGENKQRLENLRRKFFSIFLQRKILQASIL